MDAPSTPPSATPPPAGSPALQGERVSFTGTLASMTHRQALDLVEQHGGTPQQHVSRQTTMLVVGEEGWPLESDGQPSQKLLQVEDWRQRGIEIRILREGDWLHLLGLTDRRQDVQRLYTPAMLSQALKVPVGTVRNWERTGLIKPIRRVYRLPYFDFEEAAAARRLHELLAAGVPRRQIESSLEHLRAVLGDVDRPLAQLNLLARDARVLYRDDAGLVEPISGQRVFDFDGEPRGDTPDPQSSTLSFTTALPGTDDRARWTADDWFHQGCRMLDEGEPADAVEAFRLCLMDRPGEPELNFHLAEALYRHGNTDGAVERYHAAVEADHNYLEAWTQLGCLHAERGNLEAALHAFQIALHVHPDYPDAHWHAADALHRLGRTADALPHWQAYLQHDSRGPWAESARQRLAEGSTDGGSGTGPMLSGNS